jgi:hypothetical protein
MVLIKLWTKKASCRSACFILIIFSYSSQKSMNAKYFPFLKVLPGRWIKVQKTMEKESNCYFVWIYHVFSTLKSCVTIFLKKYQKMLTYFFRESKSAIKIQIFQFFLFNLSLWLYVIFKISFAYFELISKFHNFFLLVLLSVN